jgi:regulatory protein
MSGEITAIEPQKHDSNRVNVFVDGEFALGLAADLAITLNVGMPLSAEAIAELSVADGIERAKERALSYLTHRPRSKAEVRQYLAKRDFSESVIDEVITRLERVGLLDDMDFARFWVENRVKFRPRGCRMLRYELYQKGIADAIIEEALADYDEKTAIKRVAKKHARRLQHCTPEVFRRRLYGRLARRGFDYALIRDVIDSEEIPRPNSEESEEV